MDIENINNNRFLIRWKFRDTIVESLYEGDLNDKTIGQIMYWILDTYVDDLLSDNPEDREMLEQEREMCKLKINHSLLENC